MLRTRLLVAGLFVAAACSSSDTVGTTGNDALITADVATAAADGAAEDVDVMTTMDGSLSASLRTDNFGPAYFAGAPGDFRPGLIGCTFSVGSFSCPSTNHNGLAVVRVVTLFTAGGTTQSAFDPLLTASIHIVADISGDRTHGPWSATVTRHRDITVSGLAGTETTRIVNGTGSENVTNSRATTNPRAYNIVGSSVVTNVVLPVRTSDGGNDWPLSGTITRTFTVTVTAGGNAGQVTTRTVIITFNGTSSVTGTVNGTPFTIDLSGHTATPHG